MGLWFSTLAILATWACVASFILCKTLLQRDDLAGKYKVLIDRHRKTIGMRLALQGDVAAADRAKANLHTLLDELEGRIEGSEETITNLQESLATKSRDNDTLIDLTKTLQQQLGEEKAKATQLSETLQALRELLEPITHPVHQSHFLASGGNGEGI